MILKREFLTILFILVALSFAPYAVAVENIDPKDFPGGSGDECTDAAGIGYLCTDAGPFVGGPEAVIAGSQYSVSCGTPGYTWSMSCGVIDENGLVTDVTGCCGSGTVTVTDAKGQSNSMDVRFPDGRWVTVQTYPSGCSYPCSTGLGWFYDETNGGTRVAAYGCCACGGGTLPAQYEGCDSCEKWGVEFPPGTGCGWCVCRIYYLNTSTWECQ